jgi:hypothetical protein
MHDLVLYCNCFPGHLPRIHQFQQRNLMCHAASLEPVVRQQLSDQGFYFDDQGENISDQNPWLGDLTGLYWAWKNTQDEWVGTNQYRRSYDEADVRAIDPRENRLWISTWVQFPYSIAQQYRQCHGDIGLQVLWEAARQQRIALDIKMIEHMDNINIVSPCNMFFAHRTVFDRVCSVLFEIIFELRDGVRYSLPYMQIAPNGQPQTRMLAFLAERILSLIYINSRYFLGTVDVTPIRYYTHGNK